jgi:hypothetical protein
VATVVVGGALQTLQQAFSDLVSGNTVWVQAATFSVTGVLQATRNSGHASAINLIGYGTSRGDGGLPTLKATAAGASGILKLSGTNWAIRNFLLDGNGVAATGVLVAAARQALVNLHLRATRQHAIALDTAAAAVRVRSCAATGCSGTVALGAFHAAGDQALFERCVAHSNYQPGLSYAGSVPPILQHCQIAGNQVVAASGDGVYVATGSLPTLIQSGLYGSTGRGLALHGATATYHGLLLNNLVVENGAAGIDADSLDFDAEWGRRLTKTGYFGNLGGAQGIASGELRAVTMTASPYQSAASGNIVGANFALNQTVGGGLLCRKKGEPGAFPLLPNTQGVPDLGSVQSS